MFEKAISILGILASALYVGFLAYSIQSVPFWIIVAATFALMIREFIVEFRNNSNRRARGGGVG